MTLSDHANAMPYQAGAIPAALADMSTNLNERYRVPHTHTPPYTAILSFEMRLHLVGEPYGACMMRFANIMKGFTDPLNVPFY